MHSLKEYFSRLEKTSFPELAHRLNRKLLSSCLEKRLDFGKGLRGVPDAARSEICRLRLPEFEFDEKVPDLLRDEIEGSRAVEKQYQSTFFSKIKLPSLPFDIRSVWEGARLQRAAYILLFKESDSRTIQSAKDEILLWLKNNPFLYGVHYLSPMECGLRIPGFFYLLNNANVELSDDEEKAVLYGIYNHAWWIFRNLALYSSIGNHTICECIGLVFGGAIYQEYREGKKWLEKGCALLEKELFKQVLEDGGPVEQSFGYHRFVLDLYWLAAGFLDNNNLYDCSHWKERLTLGDSFLMNMSYDGECNPSIGDCDDGYAVAPGIFPARYVDTSIPDSPTDTLCRTFIESGYTLVRQKSGLFLTFDHGPLGMAPLYNHGHADALSITLYKHKKPFLIDPGTYRYNTEPLFRRYFKGTRAHNTVCIDDKDQANQVTGFIWDKPYESKLVLKEILENHISLKAVHNGYRRLKTPVEHQREIIIDKNTSLLIIDTFTGEGVHRFELNFHLHPEVRIDKTGDWLALDNSDESIFIYNSEDMFSVFRGQKDPILGWYSPSYGLLKETNTLQRSIEGGADSIRFITLICLLYGKEKESIHFYKRIME